MNLKFLAMVIVGVIGYSVWAVMAYFDPTQRHDFLSFNIVMATGTIGVVVRDMKSPGESQAPVVVHTTITKDQS